MSALVDGKLGRNALPINDILSAPFRGSHASTFLKWFLNVTHFWNKKDVRPSPSSIQHFYGLRLAMH